MSSDAAMRAYSLVGWMLLAALTALGWILLGAVSASADEGPTPSPLAPAAQLAGKTSAAASSVTTSVTDAAAPAAKAVSPLVQPAAPANSTLSNDSALLLSDIGDAVSAVPLTGRIVTQPVTAAVEPVVNVIEPVVKVIEPVTKALEPVAAIGRPVEEQAPLPPLDVTAATAPPALPAAAPLGTEAPGIAPGETDLAYSQGEPAESSPLAALKAANDRAAVSPVFHALEGIGEPSATVSPSGPETPVLPLHGGLDAAAPGTGSSLNPGSGGGVPSGELLPAALVVPLLMRASAVPTGSALPDSLSRRPGSSPD